MKNYVFSSVENFNAVNKAAKSELNGIFKNPFVVINMLNKAYKGDYNKIANCEGLSRENFVMVAKVLKGMHKYSMPFAYDFLFCSGICKKDNAGRLCVIAKSKKMPKFGFDLVDVNTEGFLYLKPVTCSIISIYNVFAKAAKSEVKETEKALNTAKKAANKETQKAIKAAMAKYDGIIRDYNNGKISEFEFASLIKTAKADIEIAKAA